MKRCLKKKKKVSRHCLFHSTALHLTFLNKFCVNGPLRATFFFSFPCKHAKWTSLTIVLVFNVFYTVLWKTVLKMQLKLKLVLLLKNMSRDRSKHTWDRFRYSRGDLIISLRNYWDIKGDFVCENKIWIQHLFQVMSLYCLQLASIVDLRTTFRADSPD